MLCVVESKASTSYPFAPASSASCEQSFRDEEGPARVQTQPLPSAPRSGDNHEESEAQLVSGAVALSVNKTDVSLFRQLLSFAKAPIRLNPLGASY